MPELVAGRAHRHVDDQPSVAAIANTPSANVASLSVSTAPSVCTGPDTTGARYRIREWPPTTRGGNTSQGDGCADPPARASSGKTHARRSCTRQSGKH